MYDIEPLEEQWKLYQRKKRRPYIIGTIAMFLLLVSGYFIIQNKGILPTISDSIQKDGIEVSIQDKNRKLLVNHSLDSLEVKTKVLSRDENRQSGKIETPVEILEEIPILEEPIKNKTKKEKKISNHIEKKERKKPRKKLHLNIIETTNVSAYKDVEKRFYQTHDIDDSLFLARAYYKRGNYKKAQYWALQTDKVNDRITESWMIFAKSKVKLGHINEAKRILNMYLKKTHSPEARNLLKKLNAGSL